MHLFRTAMFCMVSLCALALPGFSADRVFLLPSTSNNVVTVLDAGDLSLAGSIEAPSAAFDVQRSLDGRFYYIVSRRGVDTVTIVDSETLDVVDTIDLGISPATAEITPDGRYLLIAAGQLFAVNLETNEIDATIAVGSQPNRILVDDTSTTAFVLAASGSLISVVDLTTLKVRDSIQTRGVTDIALSEGGDRLLAVKKEGVQIYRPSDLEPADLFPGKVSLVNAKMFLVPGTTRVIVQTGGGSPSNTSQLIDIETGEARNIGPIGQAELRDVAVADSNRAYAVIDSTGDIVEFDISSLESDIEITSLGLTSNYRDLGLSPGGDELYASSLIDSNVVKINTENNSVEKSVTAPLAPSGHAVVFAPSDLAPADMQAIGGGGQYFPPGSVLPTRMSVRVTDRNGLPVAGVPVLFGDESDLGFTFAPEQPIFTNSRGIASVQVTVPPDPDPPAGQDPEQTPEQVTAYAISAAAGGLNPVGFEVNVIRGAGPIVISGNNQLVTQREAFPLPLVLLVTDPEGKPMPPGTEVQIAANAGYCTQSPLLVGPGGFVTAMCSGAPLPANLVFSEGSVVASVPDLLGTKVPFSAAFQFTDSLNANGVGVEKISGDNQTASAGSTLSAPLVFRVSAPFGGTGKFATEITQLSGPPVKVNPRRIVDLPGRNQDLEVTLGENAGKTVVKVTALAPGLPSATFTVNATGGRPVSLQKSGDGQSGRILSTLATPLRVQVINEAGSPVPFPEVQWTVLAGGDATIRVQSEAGGSTARVTLGSTPGPVAIRATVGTLQANFTVNATLPEPASISTLSGQNQTLTSGVLSQPLVVQVTEENNRPAAGAVIMFAGPPTVRSASQRRRRARQPDPSRGPQRRHGVGESRAVSLFLADRTRSARAVVAHRHDHRYAREFALDGVHLKRHWSQSDV